MTGFTSKVSSGGLLNIPQNAEVLHEFEKGDLIELEVVKHKKADGTVVLDKTNEQGEKQ